MKPCIRSIDALEILDSRGNPTVHVNVHLDNGMCPQIRPERATLYRAPANDTT